MVPADGGPAQAALRWSSRLGTKDPMAPSSRHLYPEWLRPRTPAAARRPAGARPRDDGAWRVWEWLRAFDRRYATLVDVVLAAGLFVLCSGWVIERTATRPDLWFVAALIFPLVFRRRAPMTVFLVIAAVAFVQWLVTGPALADAALLVALYTVALESRVAPRRRGHGHPRGRRRDGHRALDAHRQRRQVLRLPHRAGLHRAAGRAWWCGPCAASSTGWPSGPSGWSSSATSRRRSPRSRSGPASRARCTTWSRTTSR